jgi:type III secretory pathway component EscR
MSLKKELLNQLTKEQLQKLADSKKIDFSLNITQKKYYEEWNEKDKLIDLLTDDPELTLSDIEKFITKTS